MAETEIMEVPDSDTTCNICYAEFLDPDDLAVHITQMHTENYQSTFKLCQFCTKYSSSLEDYALHIRNEHLLSLKCCEYCNRVFNDFDTYRKHETKHYMYVTKNMYSCSHCKKLFHNISELELHEYNEHKNETDGVFINDYQSLLTSVLNIKAFSFIRSLGKDVVYTCIRCEMSTSDAQHYLDHLKMHKCMSLVCDGCSSAYRFKKGLLRHLDSHPECGSGKPVYKQCMECYKMFNVTMWKDHTKHCKAFKCTMCKVVFSTMHDLSQHTTKEHPLTVTLESCKYCHKEFAGTFSLDKHIERAHKHDMYLYKYTCMCCNAIFKHPKKLFAHFYSTHKDLEPYTCKICDKKFKIRKKFTIHIKLDHKSIGYIEFDKNYHVFFSDKKAEKSEVTNDEGEDIPQVINSEPKKDQEVNENSKRVQFDIEVTGEHKTDDTFNVNSDFMSATEIETEGNQTEVEVNPKLKRKLKQKGTVRPNKRIKKSKHVEVVISDSSDDEPLMELKKRVKKHRRTKLRNATWNRKKRKEVNDNKKRFVCNICKKYCYTFQNYHNHVALHYQNVMLKCVKCSESFPSQQDLNDHYAKQHSTSQLTQTLKNLLEKRKNGAHTNSNVSTMEKFQSTIRKVHIPNTESKATLTEVKDKLSVQKFIESFTPEDAPKKKSIEIDTSVTIKRYNGPVRNPSIKITKCNLNHMDFSKAKLAMPVRYRQIIGETHKVTIKEVQLSESVDDVIEERKEHFDDETYFEDDNMDRNESIPDVAQEVMLEVTEEPPPKTLYIPHRVVLPNLPKEYNKIRIAHLQSEAPYYKIVKVEDVLNPQSQEEKKKPKLESTDKKMDIKLPDGTKLVTVNPLAHLLGDTPVEKILENTKNKYYQPKSKDFEVAIAKAMLRLEKPDAFPKKRRKRAD